jgi:hypothetical protein
MPTPCHVSHALPCATTMRNETIVLTLDAHGVRNYTTPRGVVWAFEAATMRGDDGVVRDASEWIEAPTTAHELAAWLGY